MSNGRFNSKEDFDIEGKNILPSEKVKEFLQVRSIYYWNIVNKRLKDYSLPEWLACLEESALLEYAIPIFSRVIQEYPMLWGLNGEWQVLYTITKVEKRFWLTHKDWKEFFVKIIYDYFRVIRRKICLHCFQKNIFINLEIL